MVAPVSTTPGQARYDLIVEPLPRQDNWDSEVWLSGNGDQRSRYGRALSVVSAMAAAEDAAGHWVATDGRGGADDRQLPAAGWL
jgi:hypothetical protein